jgi:hypothetical protein
MNLKEYGANSKHHQSRQMTLEAIKPQDFNDLHNPA